MKDVKMVKVSDNDCRYWTHGRFDQREKRWVQFTMKEKYAYNKWQK